MTIRAIIGTIAVLAGYAVVEHSVDASTGQAGSCRSAEAYAIAQPGERLAVRAQPVPDAAIVGTLPTSAVTVISSQSGWARVILEEDGKRRLGWLPADHLMVDTRIDGAITAYNRPGMLGHALTRIEGEDTKFRVLGCRGDWLQVINEKHGNVWIDRWCARSEGCRG